MIKIAALLGALTVAIGAFGAHGLKPKLDAYQLSIFEKGVQYQFYHTLALLAVGLLLQQQPENVWLQRSGWAFIAGIVCFSGSLYLLACRDLLPFSVSWAGPITPRRGVGCIVGWGVMRDGM